MMFGCKKKEKEPIKPRIQHISVPVEIFENISEASVVRMLELEERLTDLSCNVKQVETLSQIYAV